MRLITPFVWNSNHVAAVWNQLKKRGVGVRWGSAGNANVNQYDVAV